MSGDYCPATEVPRKNCGHCYPPDWHYPNPKPHTSPELVVEQVLSRHRYKWQSITCRAGDWTYDGDNDFDAHQAKVIVTELKEAGFL